MIINIKQLTVKGQYHYSFAFDYDADNSLIDIPFVEFDCPVKVFGEIEIYDDGVQVNCNIEYVLSGECSRCLKDTKTLVKTSFDEFFVEQNKTEEENYTYKNGSLNLTNAVDDAILISMPGKLLCDDNCEIYDFNK